MKIKPIPNFPDYFISNNGLVFSKRKKYRQPKPKKHHQLAIHLCFGYKALHLSKNKKAYKRFVHRLVLETFIGPSPEGFQCRHLDGHKLNNNLSNLKWGTRKENAADRINHGTSPRGLNNGHCKLTPEDVRKIRRLAKNYTVKTKNGWYKGYDKISKKFNIACSTVGAIVQNRAWSWLK